MDNRVFRVILCLPMLIVFIYVWYRWQPNPTQVIKQTSCDLLPEEISHFQNGLKEADDPCLIRYIRQSWIIPPSSEPYNPPDLGLKDASQYGQTKTVQKLLNWRKSGFFIECGAADGKEFSNTLLLERNDSWSGLLIEANPQYFGELLQLHRKSFAINACLSPLNHTKRLEFEQADLYGGLVSRMAVGHKKWIQDMKAKTFIVQCFPLYSILLAIETFHIDYFSLDVEGPELDIIKTIPLNKVIIDLFQIEYRCADGPGTDINGTIAKLKKIRDYFKSTKLYEEVGILPKHPTWTIEKGEQNGLDVFFRRISS